MGVPVIVQTRRVCHRDHAGIYCPDLILSQKTGRRIIEKALTDSLMRLIPKTYFPSNMLREDCDERLG